MGRTVRAIRLQRFGGPEVLQSETISLPDPAPEEVILEVEWIGLNRAEVLWREGQYLVKPDLPAPIGLECSGMVVEVGEGVTQFAPGDRVGVVPSTFDPRRYGTYADGILIPAAALLRTPDDLHGPESAAVWMAYLTAWGGLLDFGGLEEGWNVVIPAASSSVGIAAIQLCRLEGAIPIAVTTHAGKAEKLRELGAEHVIVAGSEDLPQRVLEITEGKGAELFFDPVAGSLLEQEIRCAAPRARIIIYGVLDPAAGALDARAVVGRGLRVEGYFLPATARDPQRLDIAVQQIVDGISKGDLEPVIDRVFRLSEIQDAHRHLESNQQIGKVVVEAS